ncbi:MAG: sodium/proton-translocating pyrophosphatase, partial [Dehalococcoidales bacterium]
METWILKILVLVSGLLALGFVGYLALNIVRQSPGNEKMIEISKAIRDGAMAFLRREFLSLLAFTVVVAIILGVFIDPKPIVAVAYIAGTVTSALAGWLGMNIA